MMRDLSVLVRRRRPWLAAVALLLTPLLPVEAAPTLTHLFPAGGQRGTRVEVTAAGTFPTWPVQAWASPGLQVRPLAAKGKLEVTIAADATPGVGWLRLHDRDGGSNLRPFVVGTVAEVSEREPNDDARRAQAVTVPVVVNGRLQQRGDVDCFAVTLKKGATLVMAVDASRSLHAPMDAVVQLLSPDGFVLAQNHDHHGFDPLLVHPIAQDGTYTVRLFAFPAQPDSTIGFAGGENYIYRLTLTTDGYADHAWPPAVARDRPGAVALVGWNIPPAARRLEVRPPADAAEPFATVFHPQACESARVRVEPHPVLDVADDAPRAPLSAPVTVCGQLPATGVARFTVACRRGETLVVQAEARSLGFRLAPVLQMLDPSGKRLTRAEPGGLHRDTELSFTAPADGIFPLELRDQYAGSGERYRYRLRITRAQPDFELSVAADRFQVAAGKPLTIPVQVTRRHGFKEAIDLHVEGLPAGITAAIDAAASKPGAATIPVVLTAPMPGAAGAFRIVGQPRGAGAPRHRARAVIAELKRPDNDPSPELPAATVDLWVSATGAASPAGKK